MRAKTNLQSSIRQLHDRSDREGRRTAARRVHRDKDVIRVQLRPSRVEDNLIRNPLHHRGDVRGPEGLLGAIGAYSETFAKKHRRVFAEQLPDHFHLFRGEPARHRSELVCAAFGVLGF